MTTRQLLLFFITLIALIGSIIAAVATTIDRDYQLRGYVDPTQDMNLPFRTPRLGVNADLTQYAPDELLEQLELMRQANIYWVRQEFRWDDIQPTENTYNWEQWDTIVQAVNQFDDLQLVAALINSPEWARHKQGETQSSPPQNPEYFGQFASEFANQYGESIDYYQVWDEPNLAVGWGEMPPNPIQYTALLQAGYSAIHNHDAQATVMTAGIAPTSTSIMDLTINDAEFLEALYGHGADAYFDAVAGKPYGYEFSADDRTVENDTLNFSRIIRLREIMVEHGNGEKALWASHWGWNTQDSVWGQVSTEQQVTYTLDALARADREWAWMGGMTLQHWQPNVPENNPLWGFALRDSNGNATPLWNALTTYNPPPYATNGLYAPQNPYARYSGIWTFSDLGADIGWVDDSQLDFDFLGSDLALLLRQDNYVAYLYPTIDGEQANAPPRDTDNNAYIVLTSDTLNPEVTLVDVAYDLGEDIPHELHIITDELNPTDAQDRWALMGFAVSSGDLAQPYNQQIAIAWITALVAGIAVIITGFQLNWSPIINTTHRLWLPINQATQLIISVGASLALMIGLFLTWGDSPPQLFRRDSVQLGLSIITAGIIYVELHLILTIIAGIILFVIIFNRLEIGLALTIFWSPFFLFPVELYQFAFPIAEIILWMTLGAWGLKTMVGVAQAQRSHSTTSHLNIEQFQLFDVLVIIWVILGVLSLTWAERANLASTELRTLIIQPALLYAMIRLTTLDKKQILMLVDALILAGFAVAFIGIIQFIQGDAIITAEDGAKRLAGVYGSPNNLGLFLGRCIPFALAFVLADIDKQRRLLAGGMLISMGIAIALSQSVGALFIGVPMSIIAVLALTYRKRAILPIIGLIIIGVIAVALLSQQPRFSRAFDFTEGTNFYRLRVWESSLQMIADHPLTGLGLDQFLYEYRGEYIIPDAWEEPNLSHPHNIFLDFWIRLGVLGVGLIIIILIVFWRKNQQTYQNLRDKNPLQFAISIGIIGCMVDILTHGLVDNSMFVYDLAYIFMFLLALSVKLPNISAIDDKPQLMV